MSWSMPNSVHQARPEVPDLIHAHEYGLLVSMYTKRWFTMLQQKGACGPDCRRNCTVDAFSQERCIKLLADAFSARTDPKDQRV